MDGNFSILDRLPLRAYQKAAAVQRDSTIYVSIDNLL